MTFSFHKGFFTRSFAGVNQFLQFTGIGQLAAGWLAVSGTVSSLHVWNPAVSGCVVEAILDWKCNRKEGIYDGLTVMIAYLCELQLLLVKVVFSLGETMIWFF